MTFDDGSPQTIDQYSKDVSAFLMWAAEPHMMARKRIGFQVMIFLIVLAGLLYFTKKKVWSACTERARNLLTLGPRLGPLRFCEQELRRTMTKAVLGIIGGSGIYDLPGLQNVREQRIASPWGEPSGALRIGDIAGLPVVFLPRHDKGHRLSPSDINYRANIDVLKRAGVTDLVSLSACGSFKEELPPGTFVLVDQFVDRTYKRESSFFGKGWWRMSRWRIRCRRACASHLREAAEAEGIEPCIAAAPTSAWKVRSSRRWPRA